MAPSTIQVLGPISPERFLNLDAATTTMTKMINRAPVAIKEIIAKRKLGSRLKKVNTVACIANAVAKKAIQYKIKMAR